jgi:tetratricopeptide (TPR) repeat protein
MSKYLFLLVFFLGSNSNAAFCPEFRGKGLDYTNPADRTQLGIVEKFHFTEDVRTLRAGASSYLVDDLEYVLNFFPNHHPALNALTRLCLREGTTRPRHADADLECRFLWAVRAQPKDAMVPVVQGVYYLRAGQNEKAIQSLERAVNLAPDNPEVQYNLGLALYKLKYYERARAHARKAYQGGYPLPGLRNLLKEAGYPL